MPIYDFCCADCGHQFEYILAIEKRDVGVVECDRCGGKARRVLAEAPKLGKARYQMQAVLNDGSHVSGHFGKSAPLYKGGKR